MAEKAVRRREPYRPRRSARGTIARAATQGRLNMPGLRIIATLLAATGRSCRPRGHRAGKRETMGIGRRPVNSPEPLIACRHGSRLDDTAGGSAAARNQNKLAMRLRRVSGRVRFAGFAVLAVIVPAVASDPAAAPDP